MLVTALYLDDSTHFEAIDIQFTLFGTVIALFVGFTVNAAYGRWWEARTLWGQVVNSSRSLARQALVLVDERGPARRRAWPRRWCATRSPTSTCCARSCAGSRCRPRPPRFLAPEALDRVEAATNRQTAILLETRPPADPRPTAPAWSASCPAWSWRPRSSR